MVVRFLLVFSADKPHDMAICVIHVVPPGFFFNNFIIIISCRHPTTTIIIGHTAAAIFRGRASITWTNNFNFLTVECRLEKGKIKCDEEKRKEKKNRNAKYNYPSTRNKVNRHGSASYIFVSRVTCSIPFGMSILHYIYACKYIRHEKVKRQKKKEKKSKNETAGAYNLQ